MKSKKHSTTYVPGPSSNLSGARALKFKVGDRVEVYKDRGGLYVEAEIIKVRPHVSSEYKYVVRYDGKGSSVEKESNLQLIKEVTKAPSKTLKKSDLYNIAARFYALGRAEENTGMGYIDDDILIEYTEELIKTLQTANKIKT